MDMNLIALKVDPGNAVATLEQTTAKLRATETQSQQTQAAFSVLNGAFKSMAQAMAQEQTALARIPLNNLAQGFGQLGEMMARCQAVSDRLARANDPLAQGFARVAQQMQREQDVLMSIRQPQMEYFDTLTALDKLLERNAISTQEYAQQVTKLNQSIEQTPKPQAPQATVGSGLGVAGTLLAGGGAAAGVLAVGHQIEDIAQQYEQLDDTYTNLENHALKFASAGHGVSDVLAQQDRLAKNLHSTLAQAMDAYDAVQDATVDLNLNQRQLVSATQAVGEEAVISGKSMSSAGDVLNRLVLAMDSGADAGRALKTALVGYDAISDTLTAHFHTTRAGLVELGNQHKITSRDIVQALIDESAGIQQEYDKRKLTHEQEKAIIDEKIALYRQDTNSMTATFEAMNPKIREADLQFRAMRGDLDDDTKATRFLTDEVRNFGHSLDDLKAKSYGAVRDGLAGLSTGAIGLTKGIVGVVENYDTLAKHLGIVDPWHVATDAAKKYEDQLKDVRHTLDGLIDAANHLPSKSAGMRGEEASATGQANYLAGIGEGVTANGDGTYRVLTAQEQAAAAYRKELGQLLQMQTDLGLSDDQVAQKLAALNATFTKSIGVVDGVTQRQHDLQALVDGINKPLHDYEYGVELTNQALHDHAIGATEAAEHIKALRDAYESTKKSSTDLGTGIEHGWHDIVKEATNSAGQIETVMKGAFGAIQDSIVNLVTTGKLNLSSLGSALEQIIVRFAVQQATGGLIGLIGGGMTGFDYMASSSRLQFPGFATGGDMLVGGAGAPDSKLAMFRVSPGESIHVRTPEQRADARKGGSSSGPSHTVVNLNYDPRAIRQGRDIEDGVMAAIRRNPSAVRALLGV